MAPMNTGHLDNDTDFDGGVRETALSYDNQVDDHNRAVLERMRRMKALEDE